MSILCLLGPKKLQELRRALEDAPSTAVVVSGPRGCGKTAAIREICKEHGHDLVEIESMKEYSEHRLDPNTIYLLQNPSRMHTPAPAQCKGTVFETSDPCFYKHVSHARHVRMNKITEKKMQQVFPGSSASLDLHRASVLSHMPGSARESVIEHAVPANAVTFFHFIAKIFRRKEGRATPEIQALLQQHCPQKVLDYLHENLYSFVADPVAIGDVMENISHAAQMGFLPPHVLLAVSAVCSAGTVPRGSLFQVRSPRAFFRGSSYPPS